MKHIDPKEPIYELHVNDRHIATLFAPEWADMFWCSYRVEPTDANADRVIRDPRIWETVNFTIKDARGGIPNPYTFSGEYTDFCSRETDRLTFRSLCPPKQPRLSILLNRLNQILQHLVFWR